MLAQRLRGMRKVAEAKILRLGQIFAALLLSSSPIAAQRILPPTDRPHADFEIVLDDGQEPQTVATFRWIADQPRLVLHPSAGAHGLHRALLQLFRYFARCRNDFAKSDEVLDLPTEADPGEAFQDLWNHLSAQPYRTIENHPRRVRVWTLGMSFRPLSEERRREEVLPCLHQG